MSTSHIPVLLRMNTANTIISHINTFCGINTNHSGTTIRRTCIDDNLCDLIFVTSSSYQAYHVYHAASLIVLFLNLFTPSCSEHPPSPYPHNQKAFRLPLQPCRSHRWRDRGFGLLTSWRQCRLACRSRRFAAMLRCRLRCR